ncbi:uncharacterized protein LOC111710426 [Eurytemora carolleeae]|uniref:uncharacterized protein LOC111710426 n=1 Tax=Eurytemora carolleeae TaxID=1294199 RepID=UPI000C768F9A|nr:uncharacterized protein LOC111710426 [Eurytemora carolleeae]|eukprot:XP_023340279.1 uncharacterized protein LOC111710426 [Eurytemora affinis]
MDEGFVLIGAGLPRTGTMSTRAALQNLLKGKIHHMATVMSERLDKHDFWKKAVAKQVSTNDWQETLSEYRGGVDYPISFFYKEIMEAFPNAKVLLNVRDPIKWYESVKNSIFRLHMTARCWPCTWFTALIGQAESIELVAQLSELIPSYSSEEMSMFSAVAAGQSQAVQFWTEHVNQVKSTVPADRLLVWDVREGWEPLCQFMDLPIPDEPFPRVNDTASIEGARKRILYSSWFFVVFLPAFMLLAAWSFEFYSPAPFLLMVVGYCLIISGLRSIMLTSVLKNHTKSD